MSVSCERSCHYPNRKGGKLVVRDHVIILTEREGS